MSCNSCELVEDEDPCEFCKHGGSTRCRSCTHNDMLDCLFEEVD